jgi:hypothetical protein
VLKHEGIKKICCIAYFAQQYDVRQSNLKYDQLASGTDSGDILIWNANNLILLDTL